LSSTRSTPAIVSSSESRAVDPEVHRVEADEAGAGLLAHAALDVGLDVGEEERLG
jgi:hypothetical protein